MTYQEIVASNVEAIGVIGYLKMAQDLAFILDAPELNCDIKEMERTTKDLAKSREAVFDRFCAICSKAEIEIPEYEALFYMAPLYGGDCYPRDAEKSNENNIVAHAASQLTGDNPDTEGKIKSLISILELFPCLGYGRIDDEKIYAMIDLLLVQMGAEPYRPDYSKYFLRNPIVPEPAREFEVLIVDDEITGILQTVKALAGWPKMKIDFYLYQRECEDLVGQAKSKKLSEIAQAIIQKKPQIILMDQVMGDIKGDDLLYSVKLSSEDKIIFVGNTGGSGDQLCNAGALTNCRKGSEFRGLIQAIDCLDK